MNKPTATLPPVERIDASRLPEVVAVHCDAFFDYPAMRFILGPPTSDYGDRLAALIGSFLDSTQLKGGAFFGLADNGKLVGAADAVHSGAAAPPELGRRREVLWEYLGEGARARYEAYSAMTLAFAPEAPHYYLSMLGVRRRFAGRGLARPLLEEVQALSLADPMSSGVALETEDPKNVAFYRHFGYQLVGHDRVGDGVESWGFFRPDES